MSTFFLMFYQWLACGVYRRRGGGSILARWLDYSECVCENEHHYLCTVPCYVEWALQVRDGGCRWY